jgi:hypothetical protein
VATDSDGEGVIYGTTATYAATAEEQERWDNGSFFLSTMDQIGAHTGPAPNNIEVGKIGSYPPTTPPYALDRPETKVSADTGRLAEGGKGSSRDVGSYPPTSPTTPPRDADVDRDVFMQGDIAYRGSNDAFVGESFIGFSG